jgi:hypothetical protein
VSQKDLLLWICDASQTFNSQLPTPNIQQPRREFVRDAAAWAFVAAAAGGLGVRRWLRSRRTGTFPERAITMIPRDAT